MSGWQPIEIAGAAEKSGKDIILWLPMRGWVVGYWHDGAWKTLEDVEPVHPTHWMIPGSLNQLSEE